MCSSGGGGSSGAAAQQARADEEARQARINEGVASIDRTFSRFDDDFFNSRANAYTTYAVPQLDEQYAKARQDLVYALANAGLGRSSVAATRLGDLERDYARRRMEVTDQAQQYANQARADVEQARGGLISQLAATADSAMAGNNAARSATTLTAMPAFSPLGQAFQNVTAGLAAGRNATEDAAYSSGRPQGARLFQSGSGSGRVVN